LHASAVFAVYVVVAVTSAAAGVSAVIGSAFMFAIAVDSLLLSSQLLPLDR
jgi:hypothetical protein